MNRLLSLLLLILAAMACGCAGYHDGQATQIRVTGDARVYGVYSANRNFTGWK